MKSLTSYVFILFVALSCGCMSSSDKYFKVDFVEVAKIGQAQGQESEIIGMPSDFFVDNEENVYVCDFAYKVVKKYDKQGKCLMTYGKGEGDGPGEFREPRSIFVDLNKNLYVVDMKKYLIVMFDSNGVNKYNYKVKFQPTYLVAKDPQNVFVIGFPFTYSGNIIHKYDITSNINEPVNTFGERYAGDHKWEIENCGFSGTLSMTKDMKINLISFYPYSIRQYDIEGKLIKEMNRNVSFFKPPELKRKDPQFIDPTTGTQTSTLMSDSIMILMLYNDNVSEKRSDITLDFWNIYTSTYLGSVKEKELGFKLSRYIKGDNEKGFYVYEDKPYPHINKYRVNIKTKD